MKTIKEKLQDELKIILYIEEHFSEYCEDVEHYIKQGMNFKDARDYVKWWYGRK
jgi:hypothetical protein